MADAKTRSWKASVITIVAIVIVIISAFVIIQGNQHDQFEPDIDLVYGNYILSEITDDGETYRAAMIVTEVDGDTVELTVADDREKFTHETVKKPLREVLAAISLNVSGWEEDGTEDVVLRDDTSCTTVRYVSQDGAIASMYGDLCMSYADGDIQYEVLATNLPREYWSLSLYELREPVDGDYYRTTSYMLLDDYAVSVSATYTWCDGTVTEDASVYYFATGYTESFSEIHESTLADYMSDLIMGDVSDMKIYSIQLYYTEAGFVSVSMTMSSEDGMEYITFDLETGLLLEDYVYWMDYYSCLEDISFIE